MDSNRPKQILDSTFRHLEEVLEEMGRERKEREKVLMEVSQSSLKEKKPEHFPRSSGKGKS